MDLHKLWEGEMNGARYGSLQFVPPSEFSADRYIKGVGKVNSEIKWIVDCGKILER